MGSSLASASSGDSTRNPSSIDYENEMDRQSDAAYNARQQADLSRTSGDFARMDGAGYRSAPYEPAFTGNGLQFGRGGLGARLSPGAVKDWSDEINGGVALRSMRDAEIDAMAAAEKAQREALTRQRAAQAATWTGGAGAGRGFVSPGNVNPYAGSAANGTLPAGWNMRDAHAASVAAARPMVANPGDFARGFSGQYRSVLEGDTSGWESAGRYAGAAVDSLKNFAYAASGARAMDAAQASWRAGNRGTAVLQGMTAFGDAGLTVLTAGEFGVFKAAIAVDSAVVRAGTVATDGVSNAAARLRGAGVPDWNIGLRYEPSALYSNPLPLTFERVGGSPLPSGVGGTGANYDKVAGQGLYMLFDEAGVVRYVGRGDAPARIGVHDASLDKGDLIGRVLWPNNLEKAQAKGLEQAVMDHFGGALRQNQASPLLNVFRSYSPMNPNAATYREAVTPELWQATLRRIGG